MVLILHQRSWHIALVILITTLSANAGVLVDREFTGRDYPYSDHRRFCVHAPDAYDDGKPTPMVMVLHGCHQTRDTVFDEFGWDEVADAHGVIVVAPDISTQDLMRNPQCWGYW
jgi:poly(3-hydroxybutyrate) depolymerase